MIFKSNYFAHFWLRNKSESSIAHWIDQADSLLKLLWKSIGQIPITQHIILELYGNLLNENIPEFKNKLHEKNKQANKQHFIIWRNRSN